MPAMQSIQPCKRTESVSESIDPQFARDVQHGLSSAQKYLPCVYFYDELGSQLFEQICSLPEYYPTRSEAEILRNRADEIVALMPPGSRLIELGSGSSVKTRYLIEAFLRKEGRCEYIPIDVSESILEESAAGLRQMYPQLVVNPLAARYEDGLKQLDAHGNDHSKLVIWLGSSIGNFDKDAAVDFSKKIRVSLKQQDRFLIGIDLQKPYQILERAYNDSAGITARFNLNLLARINRELGANFNLNHFSHKADYNEKLGRIEMYLISERDQRIRINHLDTEVSFKKDERIHTENSHKYSLNDIAGLGKQVGLEQSGQWFDRKQMFSLNLFQVSE